MNPDLYQQIRSQLSDVQIQEYEQKGEELYTDEFMEIVTAENPQELNDMMEGAAYLKEAIKSGLRPCMLTDNEKNILENVLGKEWYIEYGYTMEDLIT
jgi:hypothetical protein